MVAKFPKRREDGTFTVDLLFSVTAPVSDDEVDTWLGAWAERNHTWVRNWHAGGKVVSTDTLKLLEAFSRAPYRVATSEPFFVIRLHGTPNAPFWRDWVARIVTELTQDFPALNLVESRDA